MQAQSRIEFELSLQANRDTHRFESINLELSVREFRLLLKAEKIYCICSAYHDLMYYKWDYGMFFYFWNIFKPRFFQT